VHSDSRAAGRRAQSHTRFLTDVSPPLSETWLDAGISMDQILAQELGKRTQLASLELSIGSARPRAPATQVRLSLPTNTISWKSQNTPLPTEHNPRMVFERLFGDSTSTDPKVRLARLQQKRSVLDSVSGEVVRLQGAAPRRRCDEAGRISWRIRDVEQRIRWPRSKAIRSCRSSIIPRHPVRLGRSREPDARPAGAGLSVRSHPRHHADDGTRAQRHDKPIRRSACDAHHPISHHQREPDKVAKVAKINAYHMQMFARLLGKLQATPDGDGTLLDHVTMMYGAGMADSNSHSPIDIPLILAGGGAGSLKGGRHIRFKSMPLANLHLTLLDQFGVHWDRIGDSTGRVDARILSL
jgi:hypothetical protein